MPTDLSFSDDAAPHAMLLTKLLTVAERIAHQGDMQAVPELLDMASEHPESPELAALAEAFAKLVVQHEVKEFELQCTIDHLQRTKQDLELANYDPLTGLANRAIARDRLQQGMEQSRRSNLPLAVFYMDLDRFKWVNDNMGHAAGDELLRQVSQRLRDAVRAVDTVARLGGDEFLCILPDMLTVADAQALAARLVYNLAQPFPLAAGIASIGTSIGIALFPDHADHVDGLIACADAALYQAKNAGRNGWRLYERPSA